MIRLENLTKVFELADRTVVAADNISLEVPDGELCVLLGPSGCGKTTVLKMINRIVPATSGTVYIDGKDTSDVDTVTLRRNLGYVIQQIGLFPNMTVEENISVVPRLLGWDQSKRKQRAADLLDMMALDPSEFLQRYPKELSGGQQQRIGVARALAADPPVLLMDEPFGAIDPINRKSIQDEFLLMQKELRKTILFVSHDIDEAVKMGDKIAILRDGKLEQFATPDDLLAHPDSDFVASFLGSDRTLKRLQILMVCDAMDRRIPVLRAGDTLEKAGGLMKDSGYHELVVLDSDNRPIGYLQLDDINGQQGVVEHHSRPLLTHGVVDEDLRSVVSSMFRHDVSWLACLDAEGQFQGYTTQDKIRQVLSSTYRRNSDNS